VSSEETAAHVVNETKSRRENGPYIILYYYPTHSLKALSRRYSPRKGRHEGRIGKEFVDGLAQGLLHEVRQMIYVSEYAGTRPSL
jgi:hypothetical protein